MRYCETQEDRERDPSSVNGATLNSETHPEPSAPPHNESSRRLSQPRSVSNLRHNRKPEDREKFPGTRPRPNNHRSLLDSRRSLNHRSGARLISTFSTISSPAPSQKLMHQRLRQPRRVVLHPDRLLCLTQVKLPNPVHISYLRHRQHCRVRWRHAYRYTTSSCVIRPSYQPSNRPQKLLDLRTRPVLCRNKLPPQHSIPVDHIRLRNLRRPIQAH